MASVKLVVQWDYAGAEADECTLTAGDIIDGFVEEAGWWRGKSQGKVTGVNSVPVPDRKWAWHTKTLQEQRALSSSGTTRRRNSSSCSISPSWSQFGIQNGRQQAILLVIGFR